MFLSRCGTRNFGYLSSGLLDPPPMVLCINIFCDCFYVIQLNSMSENTKNNEKAKINKLKIYFRKLFHEIVAQNLIFEIKPRKEK